MSSTHNTGNEENVQPTLRERTLTDVGRRTILLRFPPEFRALTAKKLAGKVTKIAIHGVEGSQTLISAPSSAVEIARMGDPLVPWTEDELTSVTTALWQSVPKDKQEQMIKLVENMQDDLLPATRQQWEKEAFGDDCLTDEEGNVIIPPFVLAEYIARRHDERVRADEADESSAPTEAIEVLMRCRDNVSIAMEAPGALFDVDEQESTIKAAIYNAMWARTFQSDAYTQGSGGTSSELAPYLLYLKNLKKGFCKAHSMTSEPRDRRYNGQEKDERQNREVTIFMRQFAPWSFGDPSVVEEQSEGEEGEAASE